MGSATHFDAPEKAEAELTAAVIANRFDFGRRISPEIVRKIGRPKLAYVLFQPFVQSFNELGRINGLLFFIQHSSRSQYAIAACRLRLMQNPASYVLIKIYILIREARKKLLFSSEKILKGTLAGIPGVPQSLKKRLQCLNQQA
ncbi:MAG: hypothetical protein M0Z43_01120 [Acidithiobacillus sp.]|nr:hypothetical protein [Acidithiobacillus sp.]